MCLLCCGGCAYVGWKGSKAMDKAVGADEPVESYWKTELRHSLSVRGSTVRQDRSYESYGNSRKMSKKEKESRDRLSALIAEHKKKS